MIAEVSERKIEGELMLRLGYGGDQGRAEWLMSKVSAGQITEAKGSLRRPVLGPLTPGIKDLEVNHSDKS